MYQTVKCYELNRQRIGEMIAYGFKERTHPMNSAILLSYMFEEFDKRSLIWWINLIESQTEEIEIQGNTK